MDRRRLLGLLPAGLCLTTSASFAPLLAAAPKVAPAALLVPLTGPSAALGLSMQRAAALVQSMTGRDPELIVVDTGGTPQGATAATALALKRGASFLLGPVFASEVRAVVAAAAGRVPVLSFSNDEALLESGAFVLGITASQVTGAILGYARRRGVRTVAILGGASPWTMQAGAVANRLQGELGLVVRPVATADPVALRAIAGGELPDALFVADGGATLAAAARRIQGSGVQLLGTVQAEDPAGAFDPALKDAWIAGPDPVAFGDFIEDFEQRNGGQPGTITALAFDGARIVKALRANAHLDRASLLQAPSFPGVCGALHFREDGSATRQLSILIATASGFELAPA